MSIRSELRNNVKSNNAALDRRLAAYAAAAGAVSASLASEAGAVIVAHRSSQPFGINEHVDIDFNMDGQIDFQIDHDRVTLSGNDLDYLQIDKNDINGANNPLAFDTYGAGVATFPLNGTVANNTAFSTYATTSVGSYPSALTASENIGVGTYFDYQEGNNFDNTQRWIRANRLIDEDATQIDQVLGGRTAEQVQVPLNGPNFIGLGGAVRYLGVRMHLNGAPDTDDTFGWIGVRIDNEADATGVVTGWAYESEVNASINAGDSGPADAADYDGDRDIDGGDFLLWQRTVGATVEPFSGADGSGNGVVDALDLAIWKGAYGTLVPGATGTAAAVPEPSSLLAGGLGGLLLVGCVLLKKWRRALR